MAAAIAATGASVALASTSGQAAGRAQGEAVSVSTSISPRAIFFGDRLTAAVEVRAQTKNVDPASVSIEADFRPYTTLGKPSLERSGHSVRLRASLACLTAACAPKTPQRRVVLAPVQVRYREQGRPVTVSQGWPSELVASRLVVNDRQSQALRTRLQPPPTAHADTATGWALVGGAVLLFVLAAGLLALRLFTPTTAGDQAELGDLDAAVAEVERLARDDAARRCAVDQLASALADAGFDEVTPQARALAWSRPLPAADSMRRLLERVERLTGRGA
jgi:hypothetical protein